MGSSAVGSSSRTLPEARLGVGIEGGVTSNSVVDDCMWIVGTLVEPWTEVSFVEIPA